MCVRVQGKGARDRYAPLADDLLERLRECWHADRPREWLLPAARDAGRALDIKNAQRWHYLARAAAGFWPTRRPRGRAGLHAPRGRSRDRVLPALQARALARRRATRCGPRGDCGAPARRVPRPTMMRMLHRMSTAASAYSRRPVPSCAGLVASPSPAPHRCCRIARAARSSRSCKERVPTPSASAPAGIAHTGR